MYDYHTSNPRLNINTVGNVGINTTTPVAKFTVMGDIGQYSTGGTSAGSPVGSSLYL